MKKSKIIFSVLALSTILFASWIIPNHLKANVDKGHEVMANTVENESACAVQCWANLECFDVACQPQITQAIQYCWGWTLGDEPAKCKCADLNQDGTVNILDLIHMSSYPCD